MDQVTGSPQALRKSKSGKLEPKDANGLLVVEAPWEGIMNGPGQDAFSKDIRSAPESEMVCYCSGIDKGQILRAVAQGAGCLADIKAATGACTQARCRELSPRGR